MKKSIWISGALIAGLLVIGTVLMHQPSAKPESPAGSEPSASAARVAPANTVPVAAVPVVAATRPPAVVSPAAVTLVPGTGGAAAMLRIKASAVLATINGVPIELKDLLPLPAGKETSDQTMPADRYAFLLDRAVDREITLQSARAQRVDLTESQREQLASLRARGERAPANLFDDLHHNPANADFEARDAAAMLLQTSLADKAGVPSRDVSAAQVESYYQQHRGDYAALPSDAAGRQAAWETIDADIRTKLAPAAGAQHDQRFREFVDQLKAKADIAIARPA